MKYKLKIQGLQTPPGTISIRALKQLVDTVIETSERGLRLVVQGESVKPGPLPTWLANSLDFTVTGIKKGSTTLELDAPELGETAPDQIKQQDLWYSKPTDDDTAISLLSRSVRDAVAKKLESNAYDKGVLEGLLSFETFFKIFGNRLIIQSVKRPSENFSIGCAELECIRELQAKTPEPAAFVISGQFDTIQHSNRRFHLVLSNRQIIPGTIDRELLSVENMREFWGKKVTIKGMVHFNPGRKVRLLEAESINLAVQGEEVFERVPTPAMPMHLFESDVRKMSVGPALREVWGKWPGEEPIDELLAALSA